MSQSNTTGKEKDRTEFKFCAVFGLFILVAPS